jgi:histidine triad (HIT) family protein
VESSAVYEGDATFAFMDLRPLNAGHTLAVPKKHVVDVYELDDVTGAALIASVSRVARAARDAIQPHGLNLWQSTGAPWLEVFHVHVHVLPR